MIPLPVLLAFERAHPGPHTGRKEQAIRAAFDCSAIRYYAALNTAIDTKEALAAIRCWWGGCAGYENSAGSGATPIELRYRNDECMLVSQLDRGLHEERTQSASQTACSPRLHDTPQQQRPLDRLQGRRMGDHA